MNYRTVGAAGAAVMAVACSSSADLPGGWEGATSVQSFTQATCSGSFGPDSPAPSIDVTASAGAVHVAYHAAQFRCAQAVQGFLRTGPKTADLLVQPTDMKPDKVAGCDCLYEIDATFSAASGPTTVTVYRRWDEESGSTDPVQVGTATVDVP